MSPRIQYAVLLLWVTSAAAFGATESVYSAEKLERERPRLESRIRELYSVLITSLSPSERIAVGTLHIQTPLNDNDSFHVEGTVGRPIVVMPVDDLLFIEELCTAYAWLDKNGYSMETVDEYITMLKYKNASAFPGGVYPSPFEALRIPATATTDAQSGPLGLRLRNSAYAFVLAHELAHVVMQHPGYEGLAREQARRNEAAADRFSLDVLRRLSEVPMGAVLFFLAQGYVMPNRGQFKAQGATDANWREFMRRDMTHPLAADRMESIAFALDTDANGRALPAERDTLQFIATRLASMAEILRDIDLQQCMALAAYRASPAVLAPRRPGNAGAFLKNCVKN